ncbi:MAG: hypothetical protein EON58_15655 [Alphaproteobacteria bacterium]|nr:MAG: hypothetical protein EON58_15655 [Alphaproteobacteria bacterium]
MTQGKAEPGEARPGSERLERFERLERSVGRTPERAPGRGHPDGDVFAGPQGRVVSEGLNAAPIEHAGIQGAVFLGIS